MRWTGKLARSCRPVRPRVMGMRYTLPTRSTSSCRRTPRRSRRGTVEIKLPRRKYAVAEPDKKRSVEVRPKTTILRYAWLRFIRVGCFFLFLPANDANCKVSGWLEAGSQKKKQAS
jgi:hypothetical protein